MANQKPSVRERLSIAMSVFRNGYPRAIKQAPFMWPAFREGNAQWQIIDFNSYCSEGFQMNAVIYSAIMYKVKTCAYSVPLRAYKGDPDHSEILPLSHPLAKLAQYPNTYQSFQEFMALNLVYLNVAGNSYVVLDRPNKNDLPTAMYPLRPDRVWIIPSDRSIKGYLYVPEGRSPRDGLPILPEDMIHVRLPNPLDPLEGMGYGLSPFAAMARSADVDNGITNYLKIFFQKGAAPNVYLKFDVPMDDATISQVKHRFQEIYGGYEKWADVGVIDQGGSIEAFGQNFKDMGFEVIDERTEARMLMPFGVPGVLIGTRLGLMRAIESNAKVLEQMFWQTTMLPELALHESKYQYYLHDTDGAYVAFDTTKVPALQRDKVAQANAFATLVSIGWTKNQASSFLDMNAGEFIDGDVAYMPLNLVPIGKPASAAPATPTEGAPAEGELTQPQAAQVETALDKLNLSGIQIQSAMTIVRQVASGEITREQGSNALQILLNLSAAQADRLIGTATNEAKSANKILHGREIDLINEAKELAISALQSTVPPPAPVVNFYAPDQPVPVVNVYNQVEPTPIQNNLPQTLVQVDNLIEPTPIQNNVTIEPPTVENKNEITVQPASAQIEIIPDIPRTEVTEIERDAQGNITRTIKKAQ